MKNEIYFKTLGQAIDGAIERADEQRALIADPGAARCLMATSPINYGMTQRFSFPLELLRDRPTKKHLQVSIYRTDAGRYELTTYIL